MVKNPVNSGENIGAKPRERLNRIPLRKKPTTLPKSEIKTEIKPRNNSKYETTTSDFIPDFSKYFF